MCMITLTSGTAFIMWLGEQITERGIGNGISMVIFAGIIIRIPTAIGNLFQLIRTDQFTLLGTIVLLALRASSWSASWWWSSAASGASRSSTRAAWSGGASSRAA